MPDPLTALKILAYRNKYEKYRNYQPNGAVEKFINLVGKNDTFISFFSAANGVGKSASGVNVLANIMFPTDNLYFKNLPMFQNFPYLKRGRIISDPTTIKNKIIPELKLWFPKDRYTASKNGKDFESYWITDTGFEFDIMSNEQDVKEFESVDLGWFWFDEPPIQSIYKATVARLRRGGFGMITATPLMGSAWLYDEIYLNQEEGKRKAIEADVEENCEEHGIRGILKHQDIQRMIDEYDDDDIQARVFGKFAHLVGLVYKKFSRDMHVIKPFEVNPRDYCVYEFLDCHPNNPDAISWVAIDRDGRKYVVDEIYMKVDNTDELVSRIKGKAANFRVIERFADPSAWNADQHAENKDLDSLAKKLAAKGLIYKPASKARSSAIVLTRDALDYQKSIQDNKEVILKYPDLYVFDICARHIWEFEHWIYQALSSKSAEKHNPSEKPIDKDDHCMENVGRALLANMEFIPYVVSYQESSLIEGDEPNLDPFGNQ